MPRVCLSASGGGLLRKSSVCAQGEGQLPQSKIRMLRTRRREVEDGQAETNNGANLMLMNRSLGTVIGTKTSNKPDDSMSCTIVHSVIPLL